jgi:hypothetical protein
MSKVRQDYPEVMAVEKWGDGESYCCSLVKQECAGMPAWYCGYVRFKHDPKVDENAVRVHGGVTYHEHYKNGTVVYGFDCAHAMDASDPDKSDLAWLHNEVERMRASIEALRKEEANAIR